MSSDITIKCADRRENNRHLPPIMPMRFALTSTSKIKLNALAEALTKSLGRLPWEICTYKVEVPDQCPQPLGTTNGESACQERITWLLENHPSDDYDYIVSIESYIDPVLYRDIPCIIIHRPVYGKQWSSVTNSEYITIPYRDIVNHIVNTPEFVHRLGAIVTYGELHSKERPNVPADNWMLDVGIDRVDQLSNALSFLLKYQFLPDYNMLIQIRDSFRYFPGFPKEGVNFMDWSNLFLDAKLLNTLIRYLASQYRDGEIKYVMGLETRGYFIALPLATELQTAFVPIRKPGKTPGPVLTKTYTKEYGTDSIVLQSDLEPGKVVIVDDILATGGSLHAAIELVQEAGHTVVDAIVIKDVPELRSQAQARLEQYPVSVLIQDPPSKAN